MSRANYTFMPGGVDNNSHRTGYGSVGGWGDQGIYTVSTVQSLPLGTRRVYSDGSVYKYALFEAAVGPGKLVAQDISVTNQASIDGKFVDSAGAVKDDYAAGDTVIYIRDSTVFNSNDPTLDDFAGGYFGISDAQGEGQKRRIKSNSIGDLDAVQGLLKITLWEGLELALDSESSCFIIGHRQKALAVANAGTDDPVVGGTTCDVAAAEYAWIQTHGVGIVLCDESAGTVAINSPAVLSDGVDGAATVLGQGVPNSEEDLDDLTTEGIIGEFLTVGVDGEYVPIFFRIDR